MEKKIDINVSKGIKVAGHTYKVKSGGQINTRLKEGEYYGRCYQSEREILLDDSFSKEQVSNSFIHEVVHAIDSAFVIRLNESQVKRLSNGLHQVLSDLGLSFIVTR